MKHFKSCIDSQTLPFSYSDLQSRYENISYSDYLKTVFVTCSLPDKAQEEVIKSLMPHFKKKVSSGSTVRAVLGDKYYSYEFTAGRSGENTENVCYWHEPNGFRDSFYVDKEQQVSRGFLQLIKHLLGAENLFHAFLYVDQELNIVESSLSDIQKRLYPNLFYIKQPSRYLSMVYDKPINLPFTAFQESLSFNRSPFRSYYHRYTPRQTNDAIKCEDHLFNEPPGHQNCYVSIYENMSDNAYLWHTLYYDQQRQQPCWTIFPPESTRVYKEKEILKEENKDIWLLDDFHDVINLRHHNSWSIDCIKTWNDLSKEQTEDYWSFLKNRNVYFFLKKHEVASVKRALLLREICLKFNALITFLDYNKTFFYGHTKYNDHNFDIYSSKYKVSLLGLVNIAQNLHKISNGNKVIEQSISFETKTASQLKKKSGNDTFLIEPLFKKGEIVLLVAQQKVGKSLFALDLSMMLATGGSIENRLRAPTKRKVLYIDAEMPEDEVSRRIEMLSHNYCDFTKYERNLSFRFLKGAGQRLNLLREDDQAIVSKAIKGHKLLVLDNLGRLVPRRGETSEQAWGSFFEWMESITSKGVTVIVVHHENKTGQHRGTGKITDDVGLVISLKKNASNISVEIEDSRFLFAEDCEPFTIHYSPQKGRTLINSQVSDTTTTHEQNDERVLFVSSSEIEDNNLNDLHIEILNLLRSKKRHFVTRNDFVKQGTKNRSPNNISIHLTQLTNRGFIIKHGKAGGTKYSLPSSQ